MNSLHAYPAQILASLFGAAVQEIGHWYDLRESFALPKYRRLLHSTGYWGITFLMVIASALGSILWLNGSEPPDLKTYAVLAAAFPMLLRRAVQIAGHENTHLGSEDIAQENALRSYFKL